MELGERIKKVRKELNLTQQIFSDRIGLKRNSLALIEAGRNPSEQTLTLICRTFRVNEEWLRGGVGEMFLKTDGNILSELAEEFTLSDKQKAVISAFLKLTDEQKDAIIEAISAVAAEMEQLDAEKQKPAPAVEEPKTYKEELTEEEHNLLEQHRRSQEARKGACG